MSGFGFVEMQEIQKELQDKYREKWTPLSPESGRDSLLWMLAEAGEAAEIIKKDGDAQIVGNMDVRRHFIEELCDVLMYLNDLMLCYSITPDELEKIYLEKHRRNMDRW